MTDFKDVIQSRQKAIELAQDATKQIITISSALIAVIAGAVSAKFITGGWALFCAGISEVLLLTSAAAGVFGLYALAGILQSGAHLTQDEHHVLTGNIHYVRFGKIQIFSFLMALLFIVIATVVASIKKSI